MPGPIAIAISAWRPAESLVGLVRTLSEQAAGPILIIDDGSGPEYREVFARAAALPGVEVLSHALRRGARQSLQTAVNHAVCAWPDLAAVVAIDPEACRPEELLAALKSGTGARGVRVIPASSFPAILQSPWRAAAVTPGAILALAFLALVGAELYGFWTTPLFAQDIWLPVGLKRYTRFIGEFLALAVPLLIMVPWTFPMVIAAILLILTAVSVGPVAVLAAGFFLLSASLLGSRLLGPVKSPTLATDLFALLLGSGIYVFLMTCLARLPVNYPLVWGVLLAIPIALEIRSVRPLARRWVSRLAALELRSPGERFAFGLLAFLLIAQWFGAMLPEISADGLAMHLAIPLDIAAHHRLTYEPARFLWSVMPMGADWLYSIVTLLGGEYAAHILDFSMLLILSALVYSNARRWVDPAPAFLLAASLAATPIVQFVTGSLFVENFLVVFVVAMLTAILHFDDTGDRRYLYLAAVLAGTAMATKYGALAFLLLALPFAVIEVRRHWEALGRNPATVCALAVAILLATALPAYIIAYAKTGNPVFPFLNPTIHSPLLDPTVLIKDERFRIPIDWRTLYTLTFQTSRAYEGQNGSLGFQYLVIVPLAVAGLLVARRRAAMAALLLGIGGGLAILVSTPNVRYLYTTMPLLLIGFASLLGWARSNERPLYRMLVGYLFLTTALNAYFLPSSNYYHKDFCLRLPFSRAERTRYLDDAAPVRKVIAWFNQHHSGSPILLTSTTATAGLSASAIYLNNWHQFPTLEKLRAASTPEAMYRLLVSWNVHYLLTEDLEPADETVEPPLKAILASCTTPEFSAGPFSLLQLKPDCSAAPFLTEVDPARQTVLPPGIYDDFDRALAWHAEWTHDRTFAEPYRHTISYTDTPGAEVSIAFEGNSLTYRFTRAPNRGTATLTVDDTDPKSIDLYSSKIEWQSTYTACCFSAGRHRAVVRVTGKSQPQSSGKFVDLDAFEVK